MRFPARPAALLAALIALTASAFTATTAVPAQAASSSASSSADSSTSLAVPASGRVVVPHVDQYGDSPGDGTMAALAQVRARTQASRAGVSSDGHCTTTQQSGSGCRWNYALVHVNPKQTSAPETEQATCSQVVPVCVHYATSGPDAPGNGITQALVSRTLESIYSMYQAAGYRMPEPDGNAGTGSTYAGPAVPANAVDIYLANIGQQGYYGYCAPEQRAGSRAHHTPAFCVLDNDFAEFPNQTPEHNLDVTVAHEFFHAVQFAYDATEDPWFMEGTAAWMESYAYPSINDNTQYLRFSPLHKPRLSMDKNTDFGVYGAWIFFRWVTEHRSAAQGGLPTIVRSMWERAAAKGKDQYSLQAVASAMKAAGLPLRTAFARFAADNRNPRHTYSKGAVNHYPVARPTRSYKLRTVTKRSGTVKINHLAAATERFVPKGHRLKRKHTKLRLHVDMANKSRGTGAVVTVYLRGGGTRVKNVKLSASGKGALTVPFSTKKVRRVELTMTNASNRMTCWVGGLFSCEGQPKDMGQLARFTAQVRR
jgi:hypothetical protein